MDTKNKQDHVSFKEQGAADGPPDKGNEMVCRVVYYWLRTKHHLS